MCNEVFMEVLYEITCTTRSGNPVVSGKEVVTAAESWILYQKKAAFTEAIFSLPSCRSSGLIHMPAGKILIAFSVHEFYKQEQQILKLNEL